MARPAKRVYEFDHFRIDAQKRLLLSGETAVPLTPKAFEMLLVLVENSGEVIDKDELLKRVWPDQIVEESNLTVNMSALRKALGESPNEHRYIVTVPGRGYQFVADVTRPEDESVDLILEEHTRSRIVIDEEKEGHRREKESLAEAVRGLFPATTSMSRRRIPSLAVLAGAALVVGLSIAAYYFFTKGRQPSKAIKSVAVLPFKSLNLDANDDYLGLGIADDLITRLSNTKQIIVRPTTAVLKYSRPDQDPAAAGRELGVESVLVSSIRRSGEKMRVTVQLVNVADGASIWADRFDENLTDILKVQDRVSEHLATALMLKLTSDETKLLAKHYTENTEAYQLYLKGRYFWNKRTPEGLRKGIEHFRQAIEKDPSYALAYAGLADCYDLLSWAGGLPPRENSPKAREAATKALEIDEMLAEAHTSLAHVKLFYDWDWSGAEREFKRAIELDPNYSTAHHWYAVYLLVRQRHEEAMAEIKLAQELDPLSLIIGDNLGWFFYFARQYDRAIDQYRKVLEMDRNFVTSDRKLREAYAQEGMFEEALGGVQKLAGLDGATLALVGYVYGKSGRRAEAQKVLNELKELSKQRHVSAYYIAEFYVGLDEKDQALTWLEKAYEERSGELVLIKVDPMFDSLRSDPRFADLLRRMGVPE